jgi:predicted 3-demethylubiquinone-9 3-methyltransferase (glyoxalase superfamily)
MTITTCLWFQNDLDAALARYGSLFDDFEVHSRVSMGDDQPAMLADWRMHGTEFRAISQTSDFRFNESISLSVSCEDQAEVDKLWYGLIADGGEESQCGWLKDAFGVSWQIVPKRLYELLSDPNPARAQAAQGTMMGQRRIVVAELEAAADAAA